ncbi:MAG: hypothetical protein Q9168_005647, partial [Polycauliona sp. 1 TL-2023]
MFSPLGLFKQTLCPEQPHCSLTPCLFSHDRSPETQNDGKKFAKSHSLQDEESNSEPAGPRKRRRISDDPSRHLAAEVTDYTPVVSSSPISSQVDPKATIEASKEYLDVLPRTASTAVSPPPLRGGARAPAKRSASTLDTRQAKTAILQTSSNGTGPPPATKKAPVVKVKTPEESLNPRMLLSPPASHAIRLKLLTMLHEHMTRLNDEVKKSEDASQAALTLSDSELITEALDEEFQIGRGSPAIYQNVIKSRIMVLRKMKLVVWKEERIKKMAERLPKATPKGPRAPIPIITDMTSAEEITFVTRLAAQQEGLNKHGYVTTMPSETELEMARKGIESAQGWEQCDRCQTRFQVFPGRREEDGALTSGGHCAYHWAKPRRPDMAKGENKSRELKYACCDEVLGTSAGCTKADSHVFKTSDPKRLALVMPFETTPVSNRKDIPGAVCFDCEMGYSTLGMELIRLTATAWPDGREVLDILVRPLGEVLDLNSRFSGVWPQDYANAIPYNKISQPRQHQTSTNDGDESSRLQIVDSPFKARDLLFSHLQPSTPLIGHALENDLNA